MALGTGDTRPALGSDFPDLIPYHSGPMGMFEVERRQQDGQLRGVCLQCDKFVSVEYCRTKKHLGYAAALLADAR
eukprot:9225379-Lingulodinium_polyedra.AAC.1